MMTLTRIIVTREELCCLLSLEDQFITNWMATGMDGIPQIPHIKGVGKSTRFHVANVEKWLIKYFERGGDKPAARN